MLSMSYRSMWGCFCGVLYPFFLQFYFLSTNRLMKRTENSASCVLFSCALLNFLSKRKDVSKKASFMFFFSFFCCDSYIRSCHKALQSRVF